MCLNYPVFHLSRGSRVETRPGSVEVGGRDMRFLPWSLSVRGYSQFSEPPLGVLPYAGS